ncbi:MAG: hypothetical protein Q7S87_09635 [Agitococcus sp.]|nr:hypothetical protein [Agitococcus sp.]
MLRALGEPSLALRYANLRTDLFTKAELLDLAMREAASFIRMGEHDATRGERAFEMTDRALTRYQELAKRERLSSPLRLPAPGCFDYIVAQFNRRQHDAVVAGYEVLIAEGKPVPDYAIVIAAASYSQLHDSRKTLLLLEPLFERRKMDIEYIRSLFYALTDTEQYSRAQQLVADALSRTPEFLNENNPRLKKRNPAFAQMVSLVGMSKAFDNKLSEAANQFNAALHQNPGNLGYHEGLGTIALWAGRPREAQSEFVVANEANPLVASASSNLAAVKFLRGNDKEGRVLLADALAKEPTDGHANRMANDLLIRQAPFVEVDASHRITGVAPTAISTEQTLHVSVGGAVYSDFWRPVLNFSQGRFKSLSGPPVSNQQYWAAGAQFQSEDKSSTVSLVQDENNQVGVTSKGRWQPADAFVVSAEASSLTADISARAIVSKVTASKQGAGVEWRPTYAATLAASFARLAFSDNNVLLSSTAKWQQFWAQSALTQLWSNLTVATLQGERQNVAYFSPSSYVTTEAAMGLSWYEAREASQGRFRKHSVELGLGTVTQRGYEQQATGALRYQLSWQFSPRTSTQLTLERVRSTYDGVPEIHNAVQIAIKVVP